MCCSLTQRCKLIEDNRGETWWRQIVPQLNSLCRCLCRNFTAGAADKWQKVQKKGWGGYIQNSERDKRENSWVHNKSFHFLHWKTGAQGRGGILSPPGEARRYQNMSSSLCDHNQIEICWKSVSLQVWCYVKLLMSALSELNSMGTYSFCICPRFCAT